MVGSKLKRSLVAARSASRSQSSACACGGQCLVDDPLQDLLAQVEQPLALLDHRRADLVGQTIERRGPILEDAGRIGIRAELPVDRRAQEGRLQLHLDDREAVGGVRIGRARLGQVSHMRASIGRAVLARLVAVCLPDSVGTGDPPRSCPASCPLPSARARSAPRGSGGAAHRSSCAAGSSRRRTRAGSCGCRSCAPRPSSARSRSRC